MAFSISGNLVIDETSGTQNAADTNDSSGNDVAGGLDTLTAAVPEFDQLLAAVVGAGQVPTDVSVSNATADNSTGSPLLTSLGSHVGDLAFTDAAGDPLDGDAAKYGTGEDQYLRTTDGAKIFLYSYSGTDLAGVDENNAVFGRHGVWDAGLNDWVADPTGAVVFAAYLQPTDGSGAALATDASASGAKVWLVEYEPILHPVAGASAASHDDSVSLVEPLYVSVAHEDQFSLAGAPSGQNLFLMYGDGTPNAQDTTIVVTGWHPANQSEGDSITTGDTVNTGKGGGDTTIGSNNQMIDPHEGMYFTFVTGANSDYTVPNLSQNEADVEANIDFTAYQGSLSASFDVVQLQPPKAATLKISAFDNTDATEKGTTYIDGLGDNDDDPVNVTAVTITRLVKTGKMVVETSYTFSEASNISQGGLTLDFTGDTAVITGIKSGDHVEYTTSALHNRVLINNMGNETANLNAAFDIGGFSVGTNTIETTAFSALAFQDDGPSVTASATNEAAVLLTTHDALTDGAPTDSDSAVTTADFSGVFSNTPVYGADGAGTTVMSYALDLYGTDGGDSGLDSNGVSINLYEVNDVITGSTATSAGAITDGNTIFSIAVAAGTGIVTLTQYAEIDHALESETGSPFDDQLAVLGAGLVKLTGTATTTDGDGDTASDDEAIDLGGNIKFADDGPSVTVSATNEESVVLTTHDAETDGDPTDSDSAITTADFSGVFSNTPVYGADGAGSTAKSYALSLYGTDGTDSLLDSNGVSINLFDVSGTIVGSTAGNLLEISAANTIFSIAVAATTGIVTLTQYAEIDHALESETGSPFDDQLAVLGAGLVKLTGTATTTDGDGDTASDDEAIDLGGNIKFADDGPSVTVSATGEEAVLLTTQDAQTNGDPTDSDSDATTADFSGVFGNTPVYGADGAGTTVMSYALDLYGTDGTDSLLDSNGVSINLYKVNDVITGSTATSAGAITDGNTIFSIAVAATTGIVTLTQYAEIDHALESETGSPFDDQLAVLGAGLVKLTGSALTTDGDGDTATHSQVVDLGGNVRFADDGPTLSGVDDSTNSIVFGLPVSPATWSAHDDFAFATGADGLGGMALVDFTDPDNAADLAASHLGALETLLGVDITATQVGNTVTYYTPDGGDAGTDPDALFSFAVTDSDWTFTILQDAPLVFNTFNFGTLSAGGPQETLSLAATNSTTYGVFDGFLFGDIDAADGTEARGINPPAPINLPGSTTADTADDLNPDAHGFGVKGGAASNMNNNEGFSISFHEGSATGDHKTVEGLRFSMDQQGNTNDVVLSFQLTDSGTMPDIVAIEEGSTIDLIDSKSLAGADNGSFWLRMGLPGGNNDIFFTILSNEYKDAYAPQANELVIYVDGSYETAMFRMAYPDTDTYDQYPGQVGDSVRVKDVTLIETMPIPDVALEFSVQGTDGDGDTTQVEVVGVMVSEDGAPFTYPFV